MLLFRLPKGKVYAKTNPALKKNSVGRGTQKKTFYDRKPTSVVTITRRRCEKCNSKKISIRKDFSKRIIDLKFTNSGVRLSITQYCSHRYLCDKCRHVFIPADYPRSRLKMGHNFIAWAIFQHIVNKQGFRVIEDNFKELFGVSISQSIFFACKDYFVRYYEDTYRELVDTVVKSQVLYVDETPFSMHFEKGYVWVFTNGEEVLSMYKPTREAGFLKEFLKDFKGILVTDFYQGYDSLGCRQQKCLIHLIRDFNSDLIKNPFNEEFKNLAKEFTGLLQKIVFCIDRFGLKQYHLNKFKREAAKYCQAVHRSGY